VLSRILLHFGLCLFPIDATARALASSIVQTHDLDALDQAGTVRELRRRYANIAIETGLPIDVQQAVADAAWRYIAQARGERPAPNNKEFRFYT
jgi:hypothetical protein